MKLLKTYFPVLLFLTGLLFGCTQEMAKPSAEEDVAAIKELINQYLAGGNAGSLDLFLAAWTEDAIRMESDFHAIVGKDAIREHFTPPFEMFDIQLRTYGEIQVEVDEDIAFAHANYILSLTAKGTDSTTHFDGKFLDIYKRQADGSWKIYIDCVTGNPRWINEAEIPDSLLQDQSDPKF